ncbi:OLC1v1009710C1 [Oldenlandia corymbosa var. corymbosa]|uniref:OLC1v1009710C1 n=1 Tax=Oldenlandia corymbosa var. corymbosa TaxID=529605 RepID=A0AAV1DPL9_OLDCO|nr:OLC1v1009710C1 [Oldenlandia corymbosa var. corymbosa]
MLSGRNMIELRMHPLPSGISCTGFTQRRYMCCSKKAVDLRYRVQYLATRTHVVFLSCGCFSCSSVDQPSQRKIYPIPHNLTCKIAGVDYELPNEGQGVSTPEERDGFDESCSEQNVNWVQQDVAGNASSRVPMEHEKRVENRLVYLEERNEETLSVRMLNLSRSNKARSALELYKSMEILGLRPDSHACNSFISCLLRNKMLDDALRTFDSMKARGMATGHTCSLILKAVADARGCDAALGMFEEIDCKCFDAVVYNTMIAVFSKVNNWVQTENLWRKLRESSHLGTVVTYRLLVCTFVRCGQSELALDAYHEMIQNGFTPGKDEMQAIIGACMKEGKWDLAITVFQNMLNDGLKPNAIACNALINSLGKAGKVKLAFRVYEMMKSLGHAPDAYTWNALLGALNKVNRHADAVQLFESIRRGRKSDLSIKVYLSVLTSYQKLGLWETALQLLWEMEASGMPLTSAPYNLAIGACEAARQPKVALQIYDHMIHQNCLPDIFTLQSLIRSCIWGSLWDEVEDILNRNLTNAPLFNAAVQGLFLSGNNYLAFKMYEKMKELDHNADNKTRALVLQNLSKNSRRR